MARLRVRLLGPAEVWLDGRRLDRSQWRTRQNRSIFLYLAAHAGQVVPAGRLIDLYWPSALPDQARASLWSRMSEIRRILRRRSDGYAPHPEVDVNRASFQPAGGKEKEFIRTDPAGYRLDPVSADVDLVVFEELTSRARASLSADPAAAASVAEEAVALCRGGLCEGEGEGDEGWLVELRPIWERRVLEARRLASEAHARQGHYQSALIALGPVLEADPLDEAACRQAMLWAFLAGETAGATERYHRLRQALRDDLGLDPSEETQRLFASLLRGEVPGQAARYPHPVPPVAPTLHAFSQGPLTGREREWRHLTERLHAAAQAGRGSLIGLTGEAGGGKSRLLQELARWTREEFGPQALILMGRAYPGEASDLGVLLEALRSAGDHLEPVTRRLEPPWRIRLASLLPVLAPLEELVALPDIGSVRPPEPEVDLWRPRFEALAALIEQAARDWRLILLGLDDLDRADAATLRFLEWLAPRIEDVPVVIMGTSRANARVVRRRLARSHTPGSLSSAGEDGALPAGFEALRLGPLNRAAVATWLAQVAPPGDDRLAHWLHLRTNGLPLFLVSFTQALVEHGALVPPAGRDGERPGGKGWWVDPARLDRVPLPASVVHVLQTQVRRLPAPAVRLAELVALAGDPCSLLELRQAAQAVGLKPQQVEDSLDTLHERDLLTFAAEGRLTLRHDLYREVLVSGLTPFRAERLHRALAGALAEPFPQDAAALARLALHREAAGDPGAALGPALRALEESVGRLLVGEAKTLSQQVQRLKAALGENGLAPRDEFRWLAAQVVLLDLEGNRQEQRQAGARLMLGDVNSARLLAERAAHDLGRVRMPLLGALAEAVFAWVLRLEGEAEEALARAHRAADFARRVPRSREAPFLWLALALALEATGDHARRDRALDEGARVVRLRASRLADEALRASYTSIPWHRELLARRDAIRVQAHPSPAEGSAGSFA